MRWDFWRAGRENRDLADLAERLSRSESQARRVGRLYAASGKFNHTIFALSDERDILQAACDIAVEAGEFRLAWIAVANDSQLYVDIAASAGPALNYLDNIHVSVRGDVPEGHGPLGTAMRERTIVVENDFLNSPTGKPWRDQAQRHGLRALICAPIVCGDTLAGGLGLYGGEPSMFGDQERTLIAELATDIGLALERLDRTLRLRSEERLRQITTEVYSLIAADAPPDAVFSRPTAIVRKRSSQNRASMVTTRAQATLE